MSLRTEKKQEQVELNILNALNQLYHTLKYTDKVSMAGISREHSISPIFSKILRDGKIITSNGKHNVAARYEWVSIKPNIHMAKEIDSKIRAYNNLVAKKCAAKKIKKTTSKTSGVSGVKAKVKVRKVNPTIENNIITNVKEYKLVASETRYLFGLIKIKTKYIYKN